MNISELLKLARAIESLEALASFIDEFFIDADDSQQVLIDIIDFRNEYNSLQWEYLGSKPSV